MATLPVDTSDSLRGCLPSDASVSVIITELEKGYGVTPGTVSVSSNVVADANGKIGLYAVGSAAASASGLLMGIGTTAAPVTTSTADAKFIEIRAQTTAATGDNRLMYLRYSINGASGGECLRAFSYVENNTTTAHGAHISLAFSAEAGGSETSLLGAAVRGTLQLPDVASWAPSGTYCAGLFEIYSDGTNSDPAGMTELSVLSLSNSGHATGAEDVDTDAYIFSLQGWTGASGITNVLTTTKLNELAACNAVGFRILVGSVAHYIPIVPAADWN